MKNSIMRSAAVILAASVIMTGCRKQFTDSDGRTELTYYELNEGELRYGVTGSLSCYENLSTSRTFDVKGSDGEISVSALPYTHQTAKGYAHDLAEMYEEDNSYSNVKVEEVEATQPTYRISAKILDETAIDMYIVRYGDQTLFSVMSASTVGDLICKKEMATILESVEYSGPPLKTETEPVENDYFTAEVSPTWYIEGDGIEGNNDLTVSYNQYDDYLLSANSFSLVPVFDGKKDAEFMADMLYISACENYEEESGIVSKPVRSTEKLFGYDAEKVEYTVESAEVAMTRMSWYLDVDGILFLAELSCSDRYTEQYLADLKPLIDSVEFK